MTLGDLKVKEYTFLYLHKNAQTNIIMKRKYKWLKTNEEHQKGDTEARKSWVKEYAGIDITNTLEDKTEDLSEEKQPLMVQCWSNG